MLQSHGVIMAALLSVARQIVYAVRATGSIIADSASDRQTPRVPRVLYGLSITGIERLLADIDRRSFTTTVDGTGGILIVG